MNEIDLPEDNFVIDIKDFNLSYNSVVLFNHFNFQVKKGQCAGIFGPTGTGKTSLLNKIVEDYLKKENISYIFQDNKLIEDLSVFENIFIPLKNKFPKTEAEKRASFFIKKLNLVSKKNEKVKVLSGGEKQRVNIARAFAYPRSLLLMDEPFSAQDSENKKNIINMTKKICNDNNITSVIVSHERDDLNSLCDFIIDF